MLPSMEAHSVPVNEMPELATVQKVVYTIALILPFVASLAASLARERGALSCAPPLARLG